MTIRRKRRPKRHHIAPVSAQGADIAARREAVDRHGAWEHCGRWACYRTRACRTPTVACFDEQGETIRDCIVDEANRLYRLAGIPADWLQGEDW